MKKRIFCIITCVLLLCTLTISSFASGIVDEGNNSNETTTESYTNTGQGISIMTTQPSLVDVSQSLSEWSYYTYSTILDTSILLDKTSMEYVGSTFFEQVQNAETAGGSQTVPSTKAFQDRWQVSMNLQRNKISYIKTVSFDYLADAILNGKRIYHYITAVPETKTHFINKENLEDYMLNVHFANFRGNVTDETWTHKCEVTWLWNSNVEDDTSVKMEKHTFSASSSSKLFSQIESYITGAGMVTPYDIIGISNYTIEHEAYMQFPPNENFTYYFIIEKPMLQSNIYDTFDFIYQGTLSNEIGGTETEVVYIDQLNIDTFIEGIKNALAVDLFGVISILDILTIIVAISITIWFLKVFAGG